MMLGWKWLYNDLTLLLRPLYIIQGSFLNFILINLLLEELLATAELTL